MGTRISPGRFDCHAAALSDEPLFTLLARDPLAPFLVSIWASARYGDIDAAHHEFLAMLDHPGRAYIAAPDIEPAAEALLCSGEMFAWREKNDGRWRTEAPPAITDAAQLLDDRAAALRTEAGRLASEWQKNDADMVAHQLEMLATSIRSDRDRAEEALRDRAKTARSTSIDQAG